MRHAGIASKRKAVGPPREGDYFFISADDKGSPLTYGVKSNVQVDLASGRVTYRSAAAVPPEEVARVTRSYTGQFLRKLL